MKQILSIILLAALLFLCACSAPTVFDAGGTALDAEELAQLIRELEDKTPSQEQPPAEGNGDSTGGDGDTAGGNEDTADGGGDSSDTAPSTVYYTAGGEVYHLRSDCSYLKSAKEVHSGTLDEAVTAGKTRACSRCGS